MFTNLSCKGIACGGVGEPVLQDIVAGSSCLAARAPVLLAAIICLGMFAGCRWENPHAEKEEQEREAAETVLQGNWRTLCRLSSAGDGQDEVWRRTDYLFNGVAVTRTENEYADSSCSDADVVVEYRGDFDLVRETTAEDGQAVWEIDFNFSGVEVISGEPSERPTPKRVYDILYLRDGDSGFFLGGKDGDLNGTGKDKRPAVVDFSEEHLKQ